MEKHKLISLVTKTGKSFKNQNPTGIYQSIISDGHYEALSHVLKAKDLVIYSLLVPRFNIGSDIDEDYDRIETNMFTIELAEIYNSSPEIDCPTCHNGYESCDNCNGTGEIECDRCDNTGYVDCDYCDGMGRDEEDESCGPCEGTGKETCTYCYGSGNESCGYCGGDGEITCSDCEGIGNIVREEESEIRYTDFVSWSGRWRMYFSNINHHEQLDSEDARNFSFNNLTLMLREYYEMSEEYEGYVEGDTFLFHMNEKPELTNRDSNGVVRI